MFGKTDWVLSDLVMIVCVLAIAVISHAVTTVDFESLLIEMTSRDALAVGSGSESSFQLLQASSFDRRSVSPDEPGWFANQDWASPDRRNFIREERNGDRTEWVLMESHRPGAVVRFWGGGFPQNGTLRFYINEAHEPVLSGKASELLGRDLAGFGNVLSSATVQLDRTDPAYDKAGFNLYAPIPYSKRMKITYQVDPNIGDQRPHFWYNINYREYDGNTAIVSFSVEDLNAAALLLKHVNDALAHPANPPRPITNNAEVLAALFQAGESQKLSLAGPAAVKRVNVTVDPDSGAAILSNIQLVLSFDDHETARVPIGCFFGTGLDRLSDVQTYFYEISSGDGKMTANWVMPFQHRATVELLNTGADPVEVRLEVEVGDWQWSQHSMYFHANYRESNGITVGREAHAQDWTYVSLEGRGRYVGDLLWVTNLASAWWGEGDEKIYVDGASYPTHFGTGTEDYYGYAWGRDYVFNQPFIGQPQGDGNEPSFSNPPGTTVNSRVRMLDAIPFEKSLRVDMELWHQKTDTQVDLGAAVFWYGIPGSTTRTSVQQDE